MISILLLISGLMMSPSQAYIKTRSSNGNVVKWKLPKKVFFYGNTINGSSMSSTDVFNQIIKGLEVWKDASQGVFSFEYTQGQDTSNFPRNSDYNQKSSIYFSSLDPTVIGMTQQWFNNANGEMLETDIQLNDSYYYFSKNPNDTTSISGSVGNRKKVFIGNVLTHELGHSMGLSHEEGLHSTMFYQEIFNQHQISCDDRAGMHSNYPNITGATSIGGRIISPSGSPLFGAHVVAISIVRGAPLSSAISDKDGSFFIEGLEPGNYLLMLEPYYPSSTNLVSYYGAMNHSVCSGSLFPRQTDPRVFSTTAQTAQSVGDITIGCTSNFNAIATSTLNDLSHPLEQGSITDGSAIFWNGAFNSSRTEVYYGFTTSGGNIRINAVANTYYSQTQASIELRDDVGNMIAPSSNQYPIYSADGLTNYDQSVSYSGLPAGHYVIRLRRNNVSQRYLAGGVQLIDSKQFFIATLTQGIEASMPGIYPDNIKCSKILPSSQYQSPAPLNDKKGGCGSIEAVRASDDGSGGGWVSLGAAIPYLLMGFMLRFARRRFNLFS